MGPFNAGSVVGIAVVMAARKVDWAAEWLRFGNA